MQTKVLEYGTFVSRKADSKKKVILNSRTLDWERPFKEQVEQLDAAQEARQLIKKQKKESKRTYIGWKLVGIISCMVVLSLSLITFLVSYFISYDTRINAEENNLTINNRAAADCESRFSSIMSAVGMFYDQLDFSGRGESANKENAARFFNRNKDIVSVSFIKNHENYINIPFVVSHEIDERKISSYVLQENENIETALKGVVKTDNPSSFFEVPVISFFYPITSAGKNDIAVVIYSSDSLNESFASGSINASILLNDEGIVLVHPDIEVMMTAADFSDNPLAKEMMESSQNNKQSIYKENDVEFIGAFRKLKNCGCGVTTQVELKIVLEAVRATTRRNIYLTIALVSVVIGIVWFFSKSISNPLEKLTAVTNEINQGNFNTDLFEELSREHRNDEIGVLMRSTKAERDILNTVSSLTNKGVARAIVRKEIDFEPHLKDITIFFSDIRGFTAISDGFKKRFGEQSSAEIIGFLNDYMSRMVNCISITGGTPDKFEGDAIMACWGVLRDDSFDYEKMDKNDPGRIFLENKHNEHKKQDALNAITATIAMRYALMKYNKDAKIFTESHAGDANAKYKPFIRIGCGLNSGRATVGFMGSSHKMEFTSIGDPVNLASRTEASNKPCGTDILITEDTYNLLKMDYIKCKENNFTIAPEKAEKEIIVEQIPVAFEVKGKGKQHFYGVVNMPCFDIEKFFRVNEPDFVIDKDCECAAGPKGPVTLAQVRKLLGIPVPDFEKVNLDEEENKIKAT